MSFYSNRLQNQLSNFGLNYYSRPDANKLFLEGLAYTERYPIFLGQNELWDLSRMLFQQQVEQGETTLDDACGQIARKYEELSQKGNRRKQR